MRLGESGVGQQLQTGYIAPVTPEQTVENLITMIVPRARQRTRTAAGDDLEFRKWWIAGEVLIWIHIKIGLMVNSEQAYLIQIDHFFKRFHKAKTQKTVSLPHVFAV